MSKEVEEKLRKAHIPNAALYTTLAVMRQTQLRALVEGDAMMLVTDAERGTYEAPGLFLWSKTDYRNVRLMLAVVAKEMVLIGNTGVRYVSLSKLLSDIENYEHEKNYTDVRHIYITDMFITSAESPMTGRSLYALQTLILDWIEKGVSVSFCADARPQHMLWYPETLRSTLAEYCLPMEV